MTFTCKGCEKREPGCHGKCEKYQAEKSAWEMEKTQRKRKATIQSGLAEQSMRTFHKIKKRNGKSRWGTFYGQ